MRKYRQTEFPYTYGSECEAQIVSPDELSAYIDKELPVWKRHLIQHHLKQCVSCSNQVQSLQQVDNFLHHSGEVKVSDGFLNSVMTRVSEAKEYEKKHESLWSRATQFIEASLGWVQHASTLTDKLRYNVRTRSPIYIFVLTFAVFTMVGATLYQSPSDRFGQPVHALKKSHALDGEKLISFEVIQHEPPKRLLTTYLQRK